MLISKIDAVPVETFTPAKVEAKVSNAKKRNLYTQPLLVEMGDLRALTLGVSMGGDESGPGGDNVYIRL